MDTIAQLSVAEKEKVTALIVRMGEEDQQLRKEFHALRENTATRNTPAFIQAALTLKQKDLEHQQKLDSLVARYGWIDPQRFGPEAMKSIFLIVQHGDRAYIEKYIPYIIEAGQQGYLPLADVAMMEDRLLVFSNKRQKYGTQTVPSVNGNKANYVWPVEDLSAIDKRRQEMGLPPFHEFLESNDLIYEDSLEVSFPY